MIKSLQQAKRFLTILFGFTLLVLGVAMLALPVSVSMPLPAL